MAVRVDTDVDEAAVRELVEGIVGEVTTAVLNEARRRAPVDQGRLRASLRSEVTTRGNLVRGEVWTPLEYGAYVHQGTGIYGPVGRPIRPVRAKVLAWRGRGGGMVYARQVRGQRPNPWLLEALEAGSPWPVDTAVLY